MDKRLEELIARVRTWPTAAQDEAAVILAEIEERAIEEAKLTDEERAAKLAALREMIAGSIERGGRHAPDDIDAMIDERFADARAQGR